METETKIEDRVSAYYKKHLKSLKLMGVFVIVSILSTSLGLGINTIQHRCTNTKIYIVSIKQGVM